MRKPTLEERVAALEKEVTDLRTAVANGSRKKDWQRTIGIFTGDEGMQELFAEAMKIRAADRARAHRRLPKGKRRQAKP